MLSQKVVLALSDYERRMLIRSLNDSRTGLLEQDKPTEDINSLLLKVINAPTQRERSRDSREAR